MLLLTISSILSLFWSQRLPISMVNLTIKAQPLAKHEFSLAKRYENSFVNQVFKDNILLTMAYLQYDGNVRQPISWSEIYKPFRYILTLQPGETFAFHDSVFPQYQQKPVKKTTKAHFNAQDGFKSDGYLFGDGVCHLASLLNWVAKDAGLKVEAPTNHNFAPIPEVPKEYGVSIYNQPGSDSANATQNLYITNNKQNTVVFMFDYDGEFLHISASELIKRWSNLL